MTIPAAIADLLDNKGRVLACPYTLGVIRDAEEAGFVRKTGCMGAHSPGGSFWYWFEATPKLTAETEK